MSDYEPLTPTPQFSTHEAQEEAIQSDARYRILKWGRRGGKNITAVMDLIERARHPWTVEWGADDPARTKLWWVGRSYDQAFKYGFQKMKSAVPDSWFDGTPKRSEPYQIDFVNGVTIEFRTYDHPETLQGAGVDHISIDEADYMPDTLWYDDLDPMLLDTRGSAMFISKPVRPQSYFQDLYDKGQFDAHPQHYSSHLTSADNPFIEENPEDKRGTVPEHKFKQQYLAELPDDSGQVFSKLGDRLFTAEYQFNGDLTGDPSGGDPVTGEVWVSPEEATAPFSIGADFAQSRDFRVTVGVDATGDIIYFKRSRNEAWAGIQAHLEAVAAHYPGVLVPDATRDNKIIADLWNAGVNLDPTKFSPQDKVTLIENLITAVEQGTLNAPDDGTLDIVWLELRQFEKEVTSSGYSKYHAPSNGHDDTVDALALANKGRASAAAPTATVSKGGDDEHSGEGVMGAIREQARRNRGNKWK